MSTVQTTTVLGWLLAQQEMTESLIEDNLALRIALDDADAKLETCAIIVARLLTNLDDTDMEGLDRDDDINSLLVKLGLAVVCEHCVCAHSADAPHCPVCGPDITDDDEPLTWKD